MSTKTLDPQAESNVETWLSEAYDQDTKNWIQKELIENPDAVNQAFYTDLEFGTGGLRGIMAIGTNRMNVYTVRRATQGLANYILSQKAKDPAVFIGYDGRLNSKTFAEETAKVLAANGIKAYLFKELRPTPLVSFGVRYKKCIAGVMITASHNPPEYNGYKVYWQDGAQVLPPHDQGIITEVYKLKSLSQIKVASLNDPYIIPILEEVDEAYLKALDPLRLFPGEIHDLKVLYTSLHGTGITLMPTVMKRWGVEHFSTVLKQCVPDGNFTYAKVPNPEEKVALDMGIEQMLRDKDDILIATDPDADRVGVAVRHGDQAYLLNGNQMACLCLDFLIKRLKMLKRLPDNSAFIKTIVTTELFKKICDKQGYASFDVLTGFKYVAEKIREWEEDHKFQFIFGGEESYGYLYGTQTRDKDALIMGVVIAEMAAQAKKQGKTLIDLRNDVFKEYGLYLEKLDSIKFPETKEGREKMKGGLGKLRNNPPTELLGKKVVTIDDYLTLIRKTGSKTEKLYQSASDVLVFWLEDESKVMIRPSGTEPKIKIYCGVTLPTFSSVDEGIQELSKKSDELIAALKKDAF